MTSESTRLWGETFTLARGQRGRFRLGPLELTVERHAHEWRVWSASDKDDPLRDDITVACPVEESGAHDAIGGEEALVPESPRGEAFRYAFHEASDRFELRPRLADRNVVIRPAAPFRLTAGAEVDVYVSTPLWVEMAVIQPDGGSQVLFDVATSRPSDTWFGPNTRVGELAYISRTAASLDPSRLELRLARAVSRIRITNATIETASLERVHLPAPELALYQDARGTLWTQPLSIALKGMGAAEVTALPGPPAMAVGAALLAPARRQAPQHLFKRALSALWTRHG